MAFPYSYGREELVAELGAVMLMQHFGIALGEGGQCAHYFQTWRDRISPEMREETVTWAQAEAEKAVRYILSLGSAAPENPEPGV